MQNISKYFKVITQATFDFEINDIQADIADNGVSDMFYRVHPFMMLQPKITATSLNFLKSIYPTKKEIELIEAKLGFLGYYQIQYWSKQAFYQEKVHEEKRQKFKIYDKDYEMFLLPHIKITCFELKTNSFDLYIWKIPEDYFLIEITEINEELQERTDSLFYKADGIKGLMVLIEELLKDKKLFNKDE